MPNESNPYESPEVESSRQAYADEPTMATGRTPGAGAITLAIMIGLLTAIGAFVATCAGVAMTIQQNALSLGWVLSLSFLVATLVAIGVPVMIIRWMRKR